jgi:hypothetical protein
MGIDMNIDENMGGGGYWKMDADVDQDVDIIGKLILLSGGVVWRRGRSNY